MNKNKPTRLRKYSFEAAVNYDTGKPEPDVTEVVYGSHTGHGVIKFQEAEHGKIAMIVVSSVGGVDSRAVFYYDIEHLKSLVGQALEALIDSAKASEGSGIPADSPVNRLMHMLNTTTPRER